MIVKRRPKKYSLQFATERRQRRRIPDSKNERMKCRGSVDPLCLLTFRVYDVDDCAVVEQQSHDVDAATQRSLMERRHPTAPNTATQTLNNHHTQRPSQNSLTVTVKFMPAAGAYTWRL